MLADRRRLQGSEISGGPQALRPLVQFAAGSGQLGGDPGLPFTAPTELRGVLPPLKDLPLTVRGRRGAGEEKREVSGFKRVPSGQQEGKAVVSQDSEAKADQRPTPCDASVAHLWSADGLMGSARDGPATPVTFGVSARELQQQALSLARPVGPLRGGCPKRLWRASRVPSVRRGFRLSRGMPAGVTNLWPRVR